MARVHHPASFHKGGFYVPPDFEPNYRPNFEPNHRPNLDTPSDAPDAPVSAVPAGGFRAMTADISPYEVLPNTEEMFTTEFVGDQTGSYAVGTARNKFTYQPGVVVADPQGDSTLLLKQLYEDSRVTPSNTKAAESFRGPSFAAKSADASSLHVPATTPQGPPVYGEIDDTYQCGTDNFGCDTARPGGACLDSKQPSWPPRFADLGGEQPQPSKVQALPVYSAMTSGVSSQSHLSSPHGISDVQSTAGSRKATAIAEGTDGADPPKRTSKRSTFYKLFSCLS